MLSLLHISAPLKNHFVLSSALRSDFSETIKAAFDGVEATLKAAATNGETTDYMRKIERSMYGRAATILGMEIGL